MLTVTPKQYARFMRKVKTTPTCWLWVGAMDGTGYGRAYDPEDGSVIAAHRLAYKHHHGHLPDLDVDHTCHNESGCPGGRTCYHRRCVNPAHLEAVTRKVNILRGEGPSARSARAARCKNGHVYTPDNTYVQRVGSRVKRSCRECRRAAQRKSYALTDGARKRREWLTRRLQASAKPKPKKSY